MRINIVVPVKDSSRAKSRLSPFLGKAGRSQLASRLYCRTLDFFAAHFPTLHVSVVTPSPGMAAIARQRGVTVISERREDGLSIAVKRAARWGTAHGFDAQLVIPADIAELSATEIRTLLNSHEGGQCVTIGAASDGGTNALLTSPPGVINFAFGIDSSRQHYRQAYRQGVDCKILWLNKLCHDIDTPADLAAFSAPCPSVVAGSECC